MSYATRFPIEAKVKKMLFGLVSPDDFTIGSGTEIDASAVLTQANISLYCLDHSNRRAIFVETAPGHDLYAAPFYFVAQYQAAQNIVVVSYETLSSLASQSELDLSRVILFYSTGRCGSTLLSRVMNIDSSTVSFGEPDLFAQLVKLRTAELATDEEITSLLHDAVKIMAADAQAQGYKYFAFKFRSHVLSVADLLYKAVPEARILFVHRNVRSWAQSLSRAFGCTDEQVKLLMEHFRYMIPSVHAHVKAHGNNMGWVEFIAHMWVTTMQTSRALKTQGAPITSASFEDLKVKPDEVISTLLNGCGLPIPPADQLAQILSRDSQEGTTGAQDRGKPIRWLTDEELEELTAHVERLDPSLAQYCGV
jgi:hypothetical protein